MISRRKLILSGAAGLLASIVQRQAGAVDGTAWSVRALLAASLK